MPVQESSGELLAESPVAVAEVMMNRALDALEACGISEPIVESYVVVGELAWDECCGILAAAPARTFKTVNFPQAVSDVTNCDSSLLAVDIVVILLRCMPSIDAQGNMPTPAEIGAASAAIANDAAIIMNAMMAPMPEGWERANLEQTFEGAEGGCVAIDTRMTIGLPQTDWCVACVEPPPPGD
jgi:hypothetical protein